MQLSLLREFVVFAKLRNFSAAARELHVSQSTMSSHIAELEKTLGFKLVKRESGNELTPAAQRVLAGVQDALTILDRTFADARDLAQSTRPVRVHAFGRSDYLDVLANAGMPPFELVEKIADADEPFEEFRRNTVDLSSYYSYEDIPVFAEAARELDLVARPLRRVPAYLCVQKGHPLAAREFLSHQDLDHAVVTVLSSRWFDFMVAQYRKLLGRDLNLEFRMVPMAAPASQRFVDLGDTVTICSAGNEILLGRDDVVVFDAIDGRPLEFEQMLVYRRDNPNPNVERLVDALTEGDRLPG